MDTAYLFAYGVTKRGHRSHDRIFGEFMGTVETRPDYLLYDCGDYPCLVETQQGEGKRIQGELFWVTFEVIDDLDMVDTRFERVHIELNARLSRSVFGYVYKRDVSRFSDCGTSWPRVGGPCFGALSRAAAKRSMHRGA